MKATTMSIGELADAVGVTRRAVRFYVQRGLLPPPLARGRGARYEQAHVERLLQILRWQEAGHSLAAIAALLEGGPAAGGASDRAGQERPDAPRPSARPQPDPDGALRVRPQLLLRIRCAEGVELLLDATRHNPDAASLVELRDSVLRILQRAQSDPG